MRIERRARAIEWLDPGTCLQRSVGPGRGRDDDLGADRGTDLARADIDVRADGNGARAPRGRPHLPLHAGIAARLQTVVDAEVARGAPDMIAAVITADGSWAGAAGIDGPKGRKAEPTDEFGIASVSKVLLASLILKLVDEGRVESSRTVGNLPRGGRYRRERRDGAPGACDALGHWRHAQWRDR